MRWTNLIAMVFASLLAQGCLFGNGEGVGEKPPSANGTGALNDPIIYAADSSECSATNEIGYATDNTITYVDGCTGKTQALASSQVGLSYLGAIATYQSTPFQLQTPIEGLDPSMTYTALFCADSAGTYGVFADTEGNWTLTQPGGNSRVPAQTSCRSLFRTVFGSSKIASSQCRLIIYILTALQPIRSTPRSKSSASAVHRILPATSTNQVPRAPATAVIRNRTRRH